MTDGNIAKQARLRLLASRQGLAVRKSSGSDADGDYLIIDLDRNWIVAGEGFSFELDDVERFLTETGE
jgi:hypothetical protein